MRILIVDDEEGLRFSLRSIFEMEGYECEEADSPKQALQHLENNHFDFILSDVHIHGGDGFILLEKVIELYGESRPKVCIMSGSAEFDKDEVIEKGAIAFFPKPFNIKEVLATLGNSVAQSESA